MAIYSGIVQKGQQEGGRLNFRTVNIPLVDTEPSGVYAAKVKIGEETYEAVAFADQVRHLLEAHIIDFTADLYGWNVKIELLKKIRNRKKFKDEVALKAAIAKDVLDVRQYFGL
jgi:riboflavin kinase / FMN adenylyltransferase